jgi:hypothetical protein
VQGAGVQQVQLADRGIGAGGQLPAGGIRGGGMNAGHVY